METTEKTKIEVKKLQSEKGIPVKMEIIKRGTEIRSEAAARSWASQHNVFTVYWIEPVGLAFGYPGE